MGTILKDRVALVTGAVGGIGQAISLHLAQEGAILALNYLLEREQDAEAFLKELTGQGYRAKLYKADVSRFDEAVRLVETVTKDFGAIDVLINNAGITIDKTLKNMGPDQWSKVIGVDLDSVFYCSRAVIEQMLERGYGRIINISSVVGQKGNFGQTNYAAAKAGIIGFTKALALETAEEGHHRQRNRAGVCENGDDGKNPQRRDGQDCGEHSRRTVGRAIGDCEGDRLLVG